MCQGKSSHNRRLRQLGLKHTGDTAATGGIESEAGPHGWGWGAVEESEKCHTRGGAGGRGNAVEGGQTCHPVPGGDPVLSLDSNQRSVEELIFETTGNVNLLDV